MRNKKKYTLRNCEEMQLNVVSCVNYGWAVSDGTNDVDWFSKKQTAQDYLRLVKMNGWQI